MKIRPPMKEYNPFAITDEINDFWSRTFAYSRTKNSKSGKNRYYFVDGPPFTTDAFGISLARNKILKDCHIRFMRSQGFNVMDRPGFDMHGLPVEVKVEEKLGIDYKTQIEEMGPEIFVTECKRYANENLERMVGQFKGMGIWLDWKTPYLTSDKSYIESVWWSIKEAHNRNLLEKQKQVTAWCSRCESPLTKGEIAYKEKNGHSVYFKIPIKGRRDEYVIVWSTTPWTFAGAMAIAVNPDFTYARVAIRQGGRKSTIIVLESQVEKIAKKANVEAYEIIESFKGSELEKLEFFHPLMADIAFHKTAKSEWCHKILLLDSVHESNTGSVYISPGFGTADFKVGNEFSLPIFSPVDERGLFTTEAGMKYAGQNIEDCNNIILDDMKSLRFSLMNFMEQHKFGHCWRCGTPIIHRATEQWFLKANDIDEILQRTARGINWLPECFAISKAHEKRISANDWCISRQRYWGTPMPIWQCIADVCNHTEVIGSINELEGASGYNEDMELHKPWIDSLSLECPKCGGLMKRIPDIVDVWFDSSIASWGQLGYPRKKRAFKELWPGDWISEEQTQFKGWFINQMFTGTMLFNKIPFRKAFVHEAILESDSSEPGGAPSHSDVEKIVGLHGPDALRLYLLGLDPCKKCTIDREQIKKSHKLLNVLWNCYAFSSSYMSMDNWNPESYSASKIKKNLRAEDIWILSRMETLNHLVKKEMENFRFDAAAELISSFILEDLSRTYIKLVRERAWNEGASEDKNAVFFTLRETLRKLSIISSPFVPYISEHIYQNIDGGELSVSMVPWPDVDAGNLSEGSERCMNHVREIVRASQKLRQESGLKLRWPVRKMTVSVSEEDVTSSVRMFEDVIKQQVNVKELELVPEGQEWAGQELIVVPNPNVIGKAYKQRESKIARMLKVLPAKDIKAKIEAGEYSLGIEGELIRILPEMVQFETKLPDGIVSKEYKNGVIYLDTVIDEEILAEGYAKEVIRRIQQMRKEMELDPEEYISISMKLGEKFIDALENWFEKIADSVRASQMQIVDDVEGEDYIVEWPMDEETLLIGISSLEIKKAMDEFLFIRDVDKEQALAIVESGITDGESFLQADREELLKIPGMTHSKLRKIKEFLEVPKENRAPDEQTCPLCTGSVEPGSVSCNRCGKSLISDEVLIVEPVDDYEDEEIYYPERPRERVKIEKKKKPAAEDAVQPEDEIVKMAEKTDGKTTEPEDSITSEIMMGIDKDREPAAPQKASVAPGHDVHDKEADEPEEAPIARDGEKQTPAEGIPTDEPAKKGTAIALAQPTPAAHEPQQPGEDFAAVEGVRDYVESVENEEPGTSELTDASDREDTGPVKPVAGDTGGSAIPVSERLPEPESAEPAKPEDAESDEGITAEKEDISDADTDRHGKSEIIGSEKDRAIAHIAETFEIKQSMAKELYSHGYSTTESLADVTEEELRNIKGIGKITARRIVQKLSSEETKMCALCNAIIPSDSPVCTRCGVKFVSGEGADTMDAEEHTATLESLDKKLSKRPSDTALLHSKAMTLIDAGKKEQALSVINEALDISPDDETLMKTKEELESPPLEPEQPKPDLQAAIPPKSDEPPLESEVPGEAGHLAEKDEQKEPTAEGAVPGRETAATEPVTGAGSKPPETAEEEIKLKQSFTYLILEDRTSKSYKMFKASVQTGLPGYCVTRTFPEKIRERYELGDVPILWLSNVAKEDAVRPKDLEKLSLSLEEFLGKAGGIVLLDGIEYLITNNNFITVLKLIQSLRDQVAIARSILLLSLNPSTIDNHQINLLKREVDSVIE